MRDLRALPKAELHIHLEGSLRIATIRELADRDGVPVPRALGDDDRWRFGDSLDFIDSYLALCRLLVVPEDFRRLATEFCADLATTGVRYAEAVFSPGNHAKRGGDWDGPIEAVLDGLAAGRTRARRDRAPVPGHRPRRRPGGRRTDARPSRSATRAAG